MTAARSLMGRITGPSEEAEMAEGPAEMAEEAEGEEGAKNAVSEITTAMAKEKVCFMRSGVFGRA